MANEPSYQNTTIFSNYENDDQVNTSEAVDNTALRPQVSKDACANKNTTRKAITARSNQRLSRYDSGMYALPEVGEDTPSPRNQQQGASPSTPSGKKEEKTLWECNFVLKITKRCIKMTGIVVGVIIFGILMFFLGYLVRDCKGINITQHIITILLI